MGFCVCAADLARVHVALAVADLTQLSLRGGRAGHTKRDGASAEDSCQFHLDEGLFMSHESCAAALHVSD